MFLSDDAFRAPCAGLFASMLLIGMVATLAGSGEARAQGMPSNMKDMPGMGTAKPATTAAGSGTVTAVSIPNRKVTLDHGPIPAIDWPAMKMEFPVARAVDLSKVKTGDKVSFTLSGSGKSYTVQSISPAP